MVSVDSDNCNPLLTGMMAAATGTRNDGIALGIPAGWLAAWPLPALAPAASLKMPETHPARWPGHPAYWDANGLKPPPSNRIAPGVAYHPATARSTRERWIMGQMADGADAGSRCGQQMTRIASDRRRVVRRQPHAPPCRARARTPGMFQHPPGQPTSSSGSGRPSPRPRLGRPLVLPTHHPPPPAPAGRSALLASRPVVTDAAALHTAASDKWRPTAAVSHQTPSAFSGAASGGVQKPDRQVRWPPLGGGGAEADGGYARKARRPDTLDGQKENKSRGGLSLMYLIDGTICSLQDNWTDRHVSSPRIPRAGKRDQLMSARESPQVGGRVSIFQQMWIADRRQVGPMWVRGGEVPPGPCSPCRYRRRYLGEKIDR